MYQGYKCLFLDLLYMKNISRLFCLNPDDYGLHLMKILEYCIRPIWKKRIVIQRYQHSEKYVHFCIQYLVGAPFAQITTPTQCGMKANSTAKAFGRPGCFDSCPQLICVVGSGVSHLPLTIPHKLFMELRPGELTDQSQSIFFGLIDGQTHIQTLKKIFPQKIYFFLLYYFCLT